MKITFALLAYNDAPFIRAALAGAFAQTYEPLEIILSDDSSTDHTYAIIQEMAGRYVGPHQLILNQNPQNLGIGGHLNRVMELASGELIILASADDVSLPHRAATICAHYQRSRALCLCSGCVVIDAAGTVTDALPVNREKTTLESIVETGTWMLGATLAWHKSIFEVFGPLPLEVSQEDEVIPFRALLLGTIAWIDEPLVRYRRHATNQSLAYFRRAKNRQDLMNLHELEYQLALQKLECHQRDLEVVNKRVEGLQAMIEACQRELDFRAGHELRVVAEAITGGIGARSIAKFALRWAFPRLYSHYLWLKYRPPELNLSR